MAEDDTGDAPPPPRRTYMPKPPSKEEVDQVSREQGMVTDEWTGEPPAGGAGQAASDEAGTPEGGAPPGGKGGGA